LARGDPECRYRVFWNEPKGYDVLLGALAGGLGSAGLVAISGSSLASAIAGLLGAGLGGLSGRLFAKNRLERSLRTLERYRIIALERGLEARGHFQLTSTDLIGTTLGGKYRILHRIGSGGIGVVYSAEHVELGSKVAIKVLRGAAAEDAAEIARLRREARVQSSIEHPNVVRTLDFDQMPDGTSYVVMELLQGASLAQRLKSGGPLPPRVFVPIFLQVCRALSAAHQLGIVHRDLKPGNVFLCNDRSVKVLDFGMSKFGESEALTQDGYTLGTPEYMSPEQCVGAPVDSRTDIYSLGVMMYEALTGSIPIWGRSRRELLELHQRMVPKSMQDVRADLGIPSALDEAVMVCLRKRAAERPQTAAELERLLSLVNFDPA
jgi:serine/threonine-protein kinase